MPQEEDEGESRHVGQRDEHVLAQERTDDGDDGQNDAGELGSAGAGIDLGELLGKLPFASTWRA